jgi:hypothetical protein
MGVSMGGEPTFEWPATWEGHVGATFSACLPIDGTLVQCMCSLSCAIEWNMKVGRSDGTGRLSFDGCRRTEPIHIVLSGILRRPEM